jgi:hypothetical protein
MGRKWVAEEGTKLSGYGGIESVQFQSVLTK